MISGRMDVSMVVAKLKQLVAKFPDRVSAALYQIAQEIMTEAKRRTPVARDGGALRASGYVERPMRRGRSISVTLGFGGAASDYAIAVHETMSEHDPPSWTIMYEDGGAITWTSTGTGDHFLSSVIDEYMPKVPAMLAKRLNLNNAGLFA